MWRFPSQSVLQVHIIILSHLTPRNMGRKKDPGGIVLFFKASVAFLVKTDNRREELIIILLKVLIMWKKPMGNTCIITFTSH